MAYNLKVNGVVQTVDVDGDTPLLWVLRDVLGMTGTKFGCGMALCGACTVHVDGVATRSCITPIDSIGTPRSRRSRRSARQRRAPRSRRPGSTARSSQCGYCQSGQIMSACGAAREQSHIRRIPISTTRCPATSAAAGPMSRIREAIKQAAQSSGQGG